MKNDLINGVPHDDYLVAVDGIPTSEHLGFVEALKMGLKLRREYPHSDVKVRETGTSTQTADAIF